MKFNEKITEIIKELDITEIELANKMELSQSFVSDIKLGKRHGTRKNIEKLLTALEVDESLKKELLILWGISKGGDEVIEKFEKINLENKQLKSKLAKVEDEIINIEKVEELTSRLEDLSFFEGLFQLPDENFIEIVKAIKEKIVYFSAISGKKDFITEELKECDDLIEKIKKNI